MLQDDECQRIEAEGVLAGDELIKEVELKKLRKEAERLHEEVTRAKEAEERARQEKEAAEVRAEELTTKLEQQRKECEQKIGAISREYENSKTIVESLTKEAATELTAKAAAGAVGGEPLPEKTFSDNFEWLKNHYEKIIEGLRSELITLKAENSEQKKTIARHYQEKEDTKIDAEAKAENRKSEGLLEEKEEEEEEEESEELIAKSLFEQNSKLIQKYEECRAENIALKRRCGDLEIQVGHKLAKLGEQTGSAVPQNLLGFKSVSDLWANNCKLVDIIEGLEREVKHVRMMKSEYATSAAVKQINTLKELHKAQLEKLAQVVEERNALRVTLNSKLLSLADKDVRSLVSAAATSTSSNSAASVEGEDGIAVLFNSLNDIKNDFEASRDKIIGESQALKEENIELKKQLHKLQCEASSQEKDTEMETEEEEEGKDGRAKLEREAEEMTRKISSLESELKYMKESSKLKEEEVAALESKVRCAEEASRTLKASSAAIEEENKVLKGRATELAEENKRLTGVAVEKGKSLWSKTLIEQNEKLRKTQDDIIAQSKSKIERMTAENEQLTSNYEIENRKLKESIEEKSRVLTEKELEILRLRGDLKEMEEQLRVANVARASEVENSERLQTRIDELVNINLICSTEREENLSKKLCDVQTECESLKERTAAEAERSKALAKMSDFAISEQRKLADLLKAAKDDSAAKAQRIEEVEQQVAALQQANRAAEEAKGKLNAQLAACKGAADVSAEKAAKGEEAARAAAAKVAALEQRLQESAEKVKKFDDLKKEYDGLRERFDALKGVEQENTGLREAKAVVEAETANLKAEVEEVKKLKDNYLVLYNHAAQKNKLLEAELAHLWRGTEASAAMEVVAASTFPGSEEARKGEEEEKQSFDVILNSLTQDKTYLENSNMKLTTKVKQLEKECAELGDTLRKTTESKDGQIKQLEESLSALSTEMGEFKAEKEKTVEGYKKENDSIKQLLETTNASLSKTEKELNDLKVKHESLSQNFSVSANRLASTEKELSGLKTAHTNLTQSLGIVKSSLEAKEKELNGLKETYAANANETRKAVAEKDAQIKVLEEKEKGYLEKIRVLENNVDKLQTTLGSVKRKIEESKASMPAEKRSRTESQQQQYTLGPAVTPTLVPTVQPNSPTAAAAATFTQTEEPHISLPPPLPHTTVPEFEHTDNALTATSAVVPSQPQQQQQPQQEAPTGMPELVQQPQFNLFAGKVADGGGDDVNDGAKEDEEEEERTEKDDTQTGEQHVLSGNEADNDSEPHQLFKENEFPSDQEADVQQPEAQSENVDNSSSIGLFGVHNDNSSTGSIFGVPSGNNNNNNNGLLDTANNSNSIFGANNGISIFGNSSNGNSNNNSTDFSIFGNSNAVSIFGAPAGGSIFGGNGTATTSWHEDDEHSEEAVTVANNENDNNDGAPAIAANGNENGNRL